MSRDATFLVRHGLQTIEGTLMTDADANESKLKMHTS